MTRFLIASILIFFCAFATLNANPITSLEEGRKESSSEYIMKEEVSEREYEYPSELDTTDTHSMREVNDEIMEDVGDFVRKEILPGLIPELKLTDTSIEEEIEEFPHIERGETEERFSDDVEIKERIDKDITEIEEIDHEIEKLKEYLGDVERFDEESEASFEDKSEKNFDEDSEEHYDIKPEIGDRHHIESESKDIRVLIKGNSDSTEDMSSEEIYKSNEQTEQDIRDRFDEPREVEKADIQSDAEIEEGQRAEMVKETERTEIRLDDNAEDNQKIEIVRELEIAETHFDDTTENDQSSDAVGETEIAETRIDDKVEEDSKTEAVIETEITETRFSDRVGEDRNTEEFGETDIAETHITDKIEEDRQTDAYKETDIAGTRADDQVEDQSTEAVREPVPETRFADKVKKDENTKAVREIDQTQNRLNEETVEEGTVETLQKPQFESDIITPTKKSSFWYIGPVVDREVPSSRFILPPVLQFQAPEFDRLFTNNPVNGFFINKLKSIQHTLATLITSLEGEKQQQQQQTQQQQQQ